MPTTTLTLDTATSESIRERIEEEVSQLLAGLPEPAHISSETRRGIIARYASVLEGNFIYWMTAAYLAARTDESRDLIVDNLREEIRDCHPGMMRRFALAAHAAPTADDAAAVHDSLAHVRTFVGKMDGPSLIAMMAFFESFIQRFMDFLADCARLEGSQDFEYTDVHSVCDLGHSAELFTALDGEMAAARDPRDPKEYLFEGIQLLDSLIRDMVG